MASYNIVSNWYTIIGFPKIRQNSNYIADLFINASDTPLHISFSEPDFR